MMFERSYILWFLALTPFFIYFSIQSYRKANKWLFLFARTKKNPLPYCLTTLSLCFSIIFVTLSLANPKVQYEKTIFNRSGIKLALGIDVSKSMFAEDVLFPLEGKELFTTFNRLNRARYFALNLLSELHGEQIGVFMFASKAVEIVPFTRDYGYCRYVLKHINETDITLPGSDLGEAIRTGISMLESSRNGGVKIIILISDGEDISLDKSFLDEANELAARKRIKIYTVGVGSGKGVLIPIRSESGASISGYYIDEDGAYLKTSLVEDTLKNIAVSTSGQYFRVSEENVPETLMHTILKEAKTVKETKGVELAWFNLSPFFLLAGLAFFIPGMFD